MKKISLSFVSLALLMSSFLSSCQQDPGNENPGNGGPSLIQTILLTAIVDAEAAWAFAQSMAGTPIAYTQPEFVAAGAAAAGALASATQRVAADNQFGSYSIKNDLVGTRLPQSLILDKNPYECVGQRHNEYLFQIDPNISSFRSKIGDLDLSTFVNLENNAKKNCNTIDAKEMQVLLENIKSNNAAVQEIKRIANDTEYKTISSILANSKVLNMESSQDLKNFCSEFVGKYHKITSKDELLTILNNKIDEELNSNNREKEQRLIFLSVLKHSFYYWSSK